MSGSISPCFWFPGNAEEAVNHYLSIFKQARILHVDRFTDNEPDPNGTLVYIEFELNGQLFGAIDGDERFQFTEALSLMVECDGQAEIDYYWNELTAEGGSEGQCGWLKDRYGVSWQIVPRKLNDYLRADDRVRAGRVMTTFMEQTRIVIAELEAAWSG